MEQPTSGPCVVWGGYGYGNIGDDLVLAVALADLRREFGERLLVFSPAPDQTRSCFPDLPAVFHPSGRPRSAWAKWGCRLAEAAERCGMKSLSDRLSQVMLRHPKWAGDDSAWLAALASASRLHLTGGGYLTDRFHLRHFLRPLRFAQARAVPITTAPLGLGPFREPKNAQAVARILRGSRLIVRDEDSRRFCEANGLSAIEQPDDGFRWRQVVDLPAAKPTPNTIGVCIFSQHSAHWSANVENWWVACLRALGQSLPGCRFEGFCFHTAREMDYETTRRLFTRAGWPPDLVMPPQTDFRAAIQNLGRYRAVVSTRFHAVVTAAAMDLPCVATALDDYYEIKMRSALKHAPGPVSLLNPLRDRPDAAAQWLVARLRG